VFLAAFVAFFAAIAVFSVATPLMDAPDEPVHVAKAAAVVRGEWTGHLIPSGSTPLQSSPLGIVQIPAAYAGLGALVHCYQFDSNEPASCAPAYHPSSRTVSDVIYNARYQPLYYAIVGLPSLLTASATGIYLMRLLSAALSAVFLALAVMAAVTWSRSRLVLAGVLVASTPSVLFFAGVVNPNGFEISVAICLWTSALILACERLRNPPPGLVALVGASAGVEALVRSMSPFWVVLTLLAALAVADWKALASFLKSRQAWIAGAFAFACGVIGTAWIVIERSLNVYPSSPPIARSVGEAHLLVLAFLRTPNYYTEMVSRFGWLSAPSPYVTYLVFTMLLGWLVLLALCSGSLRRGAVLVVMIVAVVVIPVLISAAQAHRLGITWQGKDTLPLAVGIPILAAVMIANSSLAEVRLFRSRSVRLAAIASAAATVVALWGDLRRNAVGDNGPNFFFHAAWQPPLGIGGAFIFGLLAIGALATMFSVLGTPPPLPRSRSRVSYLPPGAASPATLATLAGGAEPADAAGPEATTAATTQFQPAESDKGADDG
jgi:hypothetical protein